MTYPHRRSAVLHRATGTCWRRPAAVAAAVLAAWSAAPARVTAQQTPPRSDVFVLATLYGRHASTPAYDHDVLRRIITRIAPEVVVLDVSPRELREQAVVPSKREYPQVIFPLVREHRYRAYAGEPDEPEFSAIVGRLGRALAGFRADHPALATADRAYEDATFGALAAVWRTPADVNGALTDRLVTARRAYQDHVAGPVVAEAWRLWNEHAVAVVRRAQREHPGRRILVLIGVENAASLRGALQHVPEVRIVDMESWLRAHDVGAAPPPSAARMDGASDHEPAPERRSRDGAS